MIGTSQLINTFSRPCFTDTTDIFKDGSGVALYGLDYDASDSGNATGKFGKGAVFNGGSSRIDLPNVLSGFTNTYSFSIWVKIDNVNNFPVFDSDPTTNVSTNFLRFTLHQNGNYYFDFGNNSTARMTGTTPSAWRDNTWHHFVFVSTSTQKLVYVDGSLFNTISSTTAISGKSTLTVGHYLTNYGGGLYDQVRIFNRGISSSEVTTLYNETKNTTNTLQILGDTSCIATYPLDGSSTDLSGNYDGTDANILYKYDGSPTNVDFGVGGKSLYGARFNGSSSYINLNHNTTYSDLTMSAWVNVTSTSSRQAIFGKWWDGSSRSIIFMMESGGALKLLSSTNGADTVITTGGTLTANTWHFVCFTFQNGGDVTITLDSSTTTTTQNTSINNNNQNWLIGMEDSRGGLKFNGSIDQVRIFSKALSSAEVGKLYGNGAGEIACAYTSTTDNSAYPIANNAYYKLDNNSKDSARSTGKFNEGAVFNGSSSYINTNYTLTGSTTFTWSAWINTSNTKNTYISGDFNSGGSNATHRFSVRIYSQVLQASVNDSAGGLGTTISFGTFAHYGSWAHLVVTIDGTTVKGYVNGSQLGSTGTSSQSLAAGANPLTLGMYGSGGTGVTPFDGSIDQVRIYDTALDSTDVSNLYAETISDTSTLSFPSGKTAIATYQLDGNSTDLSGNYNGTDTNVTYAYDGTESNIEYRFGRYGQAAVFNGIVSASRSKITTSGLTTYNNFSISFWANPDDVTNTRLIMGTSDGYSTQTGFGVFFGLTGNGNLTWRVSNGTSTVDIEKSSISTSNWHHIVITQNTSNNEKKLYVNGNLETTSTSTINATGQGYSLIIGGYNTYTNTPYDGDIDQVRIYSTSLTSSQVTELYNEKPEVDTSNFKTVLYTGNADTDHYISNVGFQPDLVWVKNRSSSGNNHALHDSVRGVQRQLRSDTSGSENDYTSTNYSLKSYDANGFTVGDTTAGIYNVNGAVGGTYSGNAEFVAWCWKGGGDAVPNTQGNITSDVSANTEAGFSIVKYTADGSASMTVGHGLSQSPEIVISKRLDSSQDWGVYTNVSTGNNTTNWLSLNDTDAYGSGSFMTLSSTLLSAVATGAFWGQGNQIAYCWHSVAGYSKIGTYTGGGTSKRVYVDNNNDGTGTGGFKPSFVMIKASSSLGGNQAYGSWVIHDDKRAIESTDNVTNPLYANRSYQEGLRGQGSSGSGVLDLAFNDDGFTINHNGHEANGSGITYIYMAFK